MIPKVVMRVTDQLIRIDHRFAPLIEPSLILITHCSSPSQIYPVFTAL
jgi:hypothetical protein